MCYGSMADAGSPGAQGIFQVSDGAVASRLPYPLNFDSQSEGLIDNQGSLPLQLSPVSSLKKRKEQEKKKNSYSQYYERSKSV